MQRSALLAPLLDIAAMSLLLTSYIWVWENTFRGDFTVCLLLYLGIGFAAHLRAKERPYDLGIRIDNLGAAARLVLPATAILGAILVGAGALAGSLHFPPVTAWPATLRNGVLWGLLQQYGLLCIYYRRFDTILPGRGRVSIGAAAAVFALLHLPNPFLTAATFGAGILSCWIYRRTPNLPALGFMHGIVSFLIVESLPATVTMGMRVGPGFYNFVPRP